MTIEVMMMIAIVKELYYIQKTQIKQIVLKINKLKKSQF